MKIKGRVEVVGELGQGGLGILLKCRDESGLLFAVKRSKSESFTSTSMLEDEERRLVRHQGPHVVAYLGRVHFDDGATGLAIELMERDLTKLGRLSPQVALRYLEGVASGLADLHASAPGAFHGDLKRANVLVKDGRAKVADFGLARGGVGQTVMHGPHSGGTPGYMPPEGYASQEGDLYSLGAVFWATLVGREPAKDERLGIQVPNHPQLGRVVNRLLSQRSGERPSAAEIVRLLPALKTEAARAVPAKDPLGSVLMIAASFVGFCVIAGAMSK